MEQRQELAKIIQQALSGKEFSLEKKLDEISKLLETPKDSKLGDWAFPCFTLAKDLKKAPQAIAPELAETLQKEENQLISKIEAVGPYLNIFLSKAHLAQDLIPSILDGSYLSIRDKQADKIMVEYSQQNTHKAFHVGHIRCAALGDTVIRILEWIGHEVVASNYIGDEGSHVAGCLWYLKNHYSGPIPENNRGEFLGELYTKATAMLDLSLVTKVPNPGLKCATVISLKEHPQEKKWRVVTIDVDGNQKVVVCAGSGFQEEDLVAYASPGMRLGKIAVDNRDKKGINSEGMICSERELGLSEDNQKIAVMPEGAVSGAEVADVYRIHKALPPVPSIVEEYKKRKDEVSQVLQAVESGATEIKELWEKTKKWSMEDFYQVYDWLNCRFDHFFYESQFGESGKKLVRKFQTKGIFAESEGAIGVDLKEDNLGFCVLIKRDGTALYSTRDLALAKKKFEEFGIDRSIYVVDVRQSLHFQQVFKCLDLMNYKQASKCHHLSYGYVERPDGTMSSRKGNVILFSQLQERLLGKINSDFLNKYRDEWPAEEIDTAAYRIALATMRFGMLKHDNNSNIVFDLDKWSSVSGDTGPYMMYACARIKSILGGAGKLDHSKADWSLLSHETELDLILHLSTYHSTVFQAAEKYSPLLICSYVYELSRKFSKMYKQCSVIHADSEELKITRACLVSAVGAVIEHGLSLLGIHTVERM